jgi:oligopeptide transport system permease protein
MTLARRLAPVRVAGALALGGVAWLLARSAAGSWALAIGAAVAVVAALWFPREALVRFLWAVPLFLLLLFVSVQLMFHVPGSPFAAERVASADVMKRQNELYGIPEKSFVGACVFYKKYVEALVVDGEMGPCIKVQGRSVADVLLPAMPVSLCLGLLALLLACALGLALGIAAGLRPNSPRDYGAMTFAILGVSLPSFVIGALLILVFAVGKPFTWLPVAGWGSYAHLVLPAVALSLPYAANIARLARAGTVDVMSQDFVRTARSKGLPESEVVLKHALRGAIVPVVSFLGPAAAGIVTGSFVIETLFGIPGLGQWLVKGAVNRDYYVVLGTVLLECGIVILFNLLVDLALPWIDPRLRGRK